MHALRDVSFTVPRGKVVGIVGESGSGKSTVIWALTRLLAGNAVVEGGAAVFDGADVLGLSESAMMDVRGEKISLVFQDPMTSQSPVLSYRRQMTDVLYRRRGMGMAEKRARAVEMMRRVGIPDPESRIAQYPHQFSGGMRQRAGIAMALLMDPMLLDRRRAHHGARRDHGGADHPPDPRAPARACRRRSSWSRTTWA